MERLRDGAFPDSLLYNFYSLIDICMFVVHQPVSSKENSGISEFIVHSQVCCTTHDGDVFRLSAKLNGRGRINHTQQEEAVVAVSRVLSFLLLLSWRVCTIHHKIKNKKDD